MNNEGNKTESSLPPGEEVTITDKEKGLLMPNEFDGIRELDNPPPRWLMYVLYLTVFFSALYWVHYHTFKQGLTQEEEYQAEMVASAAASGADTTVVVLTQLTDQASLDAGKKIFNDKLCYSCHGMLGEGNAVGPNLTDDYWIHGSSIEKVVEVLINGVPAKGMAPFKDQLTKEQILQVASYVLSLHGTNPPNAKAPQGEKAG
ncbi:MAG: hypothetical protein A2X11_00790 [Bacteroidetes bacterium GWE2_42_24]|nr:MAG: hypothetical protein A2X11_00790 [Bacteroidetes bacterium GWE2_42_24]OFY27499.1 MAG: hypothetical protein A2X09_07435 [Bacteroidetes bacterium GWF2_43_11]